MKTGPAWDALLASLCANAHGAQLLADAYAAGRRDAAAIVRACPEVGPYLEPLADEIDP